MEMITIQYIEMLLENHFLRCDCSDADKNGITVYYTSLVYNTTLLKTPLFHHHISVPFHEIPTRLATACTSDVISL